MWKEVKREANRLPSLSLASPLPTPEHRGPHVDPRLQGPSACMRHSSRFTAGPNFPALLTQPFHCFLDTTRGCLGGSQAYKTQTGLSIPAPTLQKNQGEPAPRVCLHRLPHHSGRPAHHPNCLSPTPCDHTWCFVFPLASHSQCISKSCTSPPSMYP